MYITIKTIDVNYLITNLLHVENQLLSLPLESMLTVVRGKIGVHSESICTQRAEY